MAKERGKTRHFRTKRGYEKAQAYIHMHVHKGPSKHPYPVDIRGRRHKVKHNLMPRHSGKAMFRHHKKKGHRIL